MSNKANLILDQFKPFSQSMFWQAQRNFYHNKGVEAWAGQVPFYITSNPFIAHTYAEIIVRFTQDWVRNHPNSEKHPFYIVELGAGTGQFSFYVLEAIQKLQKSLNLSHITLRYLMTDFTENNLKFWQQHEKLQPFVDKGLLDFALFDIEKDNHIKSVHQHILLQQGCSINPICVCANYLFDSIINDIFLVKNNQILEASVSLSTEKDHTIGEHPVDWEKIKITHREKSIDVGYYDDPVLDNILFNYRSQLKDTFMLYPIGCLRGLSTLKHFANDQLLLLSSDKGHSSLNELDALDFPELDFHGSFSLMVNYHAVAQYCAENQGEGSIQTPRDGLISGVFSCGFKLNNLYETRYTIDRYIEEFSPTDFFNYYELTDSIHEKTDLKTLASTLCLSRWDPFIFETMATRLNQQFETVDTEIIDFIIKNLPKVIDNFFYVPQCDDVPFSVATLFYNIDDFDRAIHCYKMSQHYFGPNFENTYNIALCHYYSERFDLAADFFEYALKFNPKNHETKQFLQKCKQHMSSTD